MAKRTLRFADFPTDHLKCRSLGHAWDIKMTSVIRPKHGGQAYRVLLVCGRCDTERTDDVRVSDGDRTRRMYGYPDGYLIKDAKSWGGRWEFVRNARVELYGRYIKKGD